jgi:radical SAM superfamily enzyme YgiQ (UPF0313 family)
MNILLMSMPDITLGYPTKVITPPNLAIISLAGNLDKKHKVKAADLISRRKNIQGAVLETLNRTNPDVVGLSAMTFQYDTALRIARFIKNVHPGIKIALGGYHATLMYKEIANCNDGESFDFIFRGESDLSFNEAMNILEDGGNLRSVNGLSFKENGTFIHNKKRGLENINQIKPPNRSARLWNECNVLKVPFDLIESSRGCQKSCNFCNIRNMYGKSFRTYEPQRVIEDIKNARSLGTKMMLFTDDNITLDIPKFEHLCDEIIKYGQNDIIYSVQASSSGIASSQNLAKKMFRAGFKYVFLGIENASKKNLEALDKGDIVNESKLAVKYLQENGIVVAGGLIIGNPDDDYESIEETFKFARDLKVDFAGVQFLVPYPKTVIRKKLLKNGLLINKDNFKRYEGGFAIARTKYLNENELKSIKHKMAKKYFKNRKVNTFSVLLKHKKSSLKLLKGGVGLIPDLISFLILGKMIKLFLNENKIADRHYQKKLKTNEFNI